MKRILLSFLGVAAVALAGNAATLNIGSVETKDPTRNLEKAETFNITIESPDVSGWGWANRTPSDDVVPSVTNGTDTFEGTLTRGLGVDAGTFVLSFEPAITTPGTYTLILPANLFRIGQEGFYTYNAEYTLPDFFTIAGGGEDPTPVVKEYFKGAFIGLPDPGNLEEYDNQLTGVGIMLPNFPVEEADGAVLNVDYSKITIAGQPVSRFYDEDEDEYAEAQVWPPNMEGGYVMVNIPFEPYTTPGTFEVVVADGAITLNDVANTDAITAEYTIDADDSVLTYTFDPQPGVSLESIETINIAFSDYIDINFDMTEGEELGNANCEVLNLINENGTPFECKTLDWNLDDMKIVILTYDEITADGTYTLTIPEGLFIVYGEDDSYAKQSPAITAKFIIGDITYVASVFEGAETINVVDLSGRTVLRGAEATAVSSLEPGIYVINGKKVIIRK